MLDWPWVMFFVLGGPWFWVLFSVWLFVMVGILDALDYYDYYDKHYHRGRYAVGTFVLFLLLLLTCGNGLSVVQWVRTNPMLFLQWAGIFLVSYIPAGLLVAFIKWWYWNKDDDEEFRDVRDAWLRDHGLALIDGSVPPAVRKDFLKYLVNNHYRWARHENTYDRDSKIVPYWPTWRDNKARIGSWMTWWWIVGPWSLIDDVVRNLFKRIMQMFGGWFDRISNAIHGHMKDNFDLPESPEPAHESELIDPEIRVAPRQRKARGEQL
jgi:hypothetical protein